MRLLIIVYVYLYNISRWILSSHSLNQERYLDDLYLSSASETEQISKVCGLSNLSELVRYVSLRLSVH